MNLLNWQRRGILAAVGVLAFFVVGHTLLSSSKWINRPFPGFFLYGNLTVTPDFLPQWSGERAGLRFLDHIVAVEGKTVRKPGAVYDLVHRHPAGTPFRYTVEKGGTLYEIVVPSMNLSFNDWLLSFGVYLLIGIGFLAIGFTSFHLRSTSPAAAALFFMVSTVLVWFATTFDFVTTQGLPKEVRIFAFSLAPTLGIHLGLLLTQGRHRRKGHFIYLSVIYGMSIVIGLFYSWSFYGPLEVWQWALRLGYGYCCLAALVFLGLLWAALGDHLSELERSRLRVVLVGAFLGFFLPTLGTVLTTFFYWEIPYNLLVIPVVFFPLSVAYALLKYSLFDLSTVLKLSLTRGALTSVLLLLYVLVVFILSVSVGVYERNLMVPLLFAILVVLVFNPLLRWIEGVVDRFVYRTEYDPDQLQSQVSVLLRTLSKPQTVALRFLKLIGSRIGVETGILFSRLRTQDRYLEVSLDGETHGNQEIYRRLGLLWTQHAGMHENVISRDEVENDPALQGTRGELLGNFKTLKADILIPITFEERILGFICLGKKRSGREYSADDFKLLGRLADQLALSLENGMLFEESEIAKEKFRHLYDESLVMNRRLVETDKFKKQFVANISHELRTPVSTILGYGEVLLDPDFQGDSRAILERVVNNGQELSYLMDSLLDFSRIEAGSMEVSLEEVKVREIFQALEIMTRRLVKARPIRFRAHIESALEVIETDPKKLQQILTHFLTNALKFTEQGEITLETKTLFNEGDPLIAISVSDTGIGINKQDQEIVFQEFRQLDGSSRRKYGGTGLGLGLCRKLAQSLGGRIEIESEIGRGSIFSVILPPRRTHPQAA